MSRGTSAPPDPRTLPKCSQMLPKLLKALPPHCTLPDRENGTNPRARRSNLGFRGNRKCKNRIRTQEITTFADFACCRRPSWGIIVYNQNSYSRSRNTRNCDFLMGQIHRLNCHLKASPISENATNNQLIFTDLWFADRLEACIEHMSTLQH